MKKLILLSVFIALTFSACQPKVVYVDKPCPKLQTKVVEAPKGIHYEIRRKSPDK